MALPPIERPKTMGGAAGARLRAEQKPRSGRTEVSPAPVVPVCIILTTNYRLDHAPCPQVQFSVSGVGLRQAEGSEERRSGVTSRISMHGPLHWGGWI